MPQTVRIWFDKEGDFLEVRFSDQPGFMRETDHDARQVTEGTERRKENTEKWLGIRGLLDELTRWVKS